MINTKVWYGVLQDLNLEPPFFLAYINNLTEYLMANAKLFADDASLLSVVQESKAPSVSLNNGFLKISQWAYQSKTMFNQDVSKQAQEVAVSSKAIAINHASVYFSIVIRENFQKYLDLFLDSKPNFFDHVNEKIKKGTKGINFFRKMDFLLQRPFLFTIFKSFVRPHLVYGDVIYSQTNNASLLDKIESIQFNTVLA